MNATDNDATLPDEHELIPLTLTGPEVLPKLTLTLVAVVVRLVPVDVTTPSEIFDPVGTYQV